MLDHNLFELLFIESLLAKAYVLVAYLRQNSGVRVQRFLRVHNLRVANHLIELFFTRV